MKFEFTHRFDADPEAVADAMMDARYQESLEDVSRELKSRKVVLQEERDGHTFRQIRCVVGIDLGPAKRFIGDHEPAFVQEESFDPGSRRLRWKIKPEVASQMLRAEGLVELRADGEGTERSVTGDVRVPVPFYGKRVEQIIVEHLGRGYDDEAERLAQWLSGEGS